MTAIAGVWCHDGTGGAFGLADRMARSLRVYGPDRSGSCDIAEAGLALVCQQSHITNTDMIDRQPLWDHQGRLCVVADARIDNMAELAVQLGWARGEADSCSDAAVILAAYHRWGPDCLDRLIGDYAFALWDGQAQSLLLARDAVGSRPLFFAQRPGLFAFASMPRGLFALGAFSSALDPVELAAYVATLPQEAGRTLYQDLSLVPPGHYLLVQGERRQMVQHWPGPLLEPAPSGDYRAYVEEFRRLYADAVRVRLRVRSGAGIGSQLSAGFDSSSVTALAARELSAQGRSLHAFTAAPRAGFTGPNPTGRVLDESLVAGELACRFNNIDHHVIRTGPESRLRGLERTLPYLEMPFLNICNLGWCRAIDEAAARCGAKVLLKGSLGNLTSSFEGESLLNKLFAQGRWPQAARLGYGMRRDGASWRRLAALTIAPYLPRWLVNRLRRATKGDIFSFTSLSPAFAAAIDIKALATSRGRTLDFAQTVHDGRMARLKALHRTERSVYHHATLAEFGVDTRDPTADRRLIDFCLTVPESFFIRDGRRASLFRDAMAGLLPDTMLNSRIRGLQAADWYEGLVASRDEMAMELERLAASPMASRILDIDRLRRLVAALPDPTTPVDQLPARELVGAESVQAYRLALLRGLSVGRFIRMVEGGNG